MVMSRREGGAAYLSLLVAVAVVSAILANTAEIVSRTMQRDRERHLLWVGEQIRVALLSYSKIPAGVNTYPNELHELVEDRRRTVVQRHLRRLYFDPMTGSEEWGLIRNAQKRIIGVYSNSTLKPIRTAGFAQHYAHFAKAKSYGDWRFGIGTLLPPEEAAKSPPEGNAEAPPANDAEGEVPGVGDAADGRTGLQPLPGKVVAGGKKGGTPSGGSAARPGTADGTSRPPLSGGGTPIRPPPLARPPETATPEAPPAEEAPAVELPVDAGGQGAVDAPIEGQ
jgi:type II secretory pathway pseudopilin PulG